jgi:acyl carrier protein
VNQEELVAKVQKAFSKTFGRQITFKPELSRVNEPRWTSLKHVEFVVALESEFGVRFDGADATDMTSVPAVVEKLKQRLS